MNTGHGGRHASRRTHGRAPQTPQYDAGRSVGRNRRATRFDSWMLAIRWTRGATALAVRLTSRTAAETTALAISCTMAELLSLEETLARWSLTLNSAAVPAR